MKIDKKIIKELSDYLDEFNLTELEYTEKDTKIKVSKNKVAVSNPTIQNKDISKSTITKLENKQSGIEISSPIIGTAYHAPEPGVKNLLKLEKNQKR